MPSHDGQEMPGSIDLSATEGVFKNYSFTSSLLGPPFINLDLRGKYPESYRHACLEYGAGQHAACQTDWHFPAVTYS